MQDSRDFVLGTILILGSAIAYSLSGYFTRLIALDVATVLFWRGLFGGAFIATFLFWQRESSLKEDVIAMGRSGLAIMGLSTLATISFICALTFAPVAEVMTIHAAIPFLTAVIAFALFRVRESRATWAASVVAMVGVAIMVDFGAASSHLAGYAFATAMALAYAAMMVIIRQNRGVSMLPAACLSAFLCSLVVLPFAMPLEVSVGDLGQLALFGTIQFGLGLLLMMLGTRLISATSSALIGSLENPLAPLWVWLAFAEAPTLATIIGGGLVMLAVSVDTALKAQASSGSGLKRSQNERDKLG